jgi:arsenate reductase (thioredoxin)
MQSVLFLCTGNSCRSQMAEAIVANDCRGQWQAFSAGTMPTGYVNSVALQVLKEIGIEHQGRSKSIQEYYGQTFDQVITVCDDAEANCPVWLGHGKKVHIGFRDPGRFSGTNEEVIQEFREVRDQIRKEIIDYLLTVED